MAYTTIDDASLYFRIKTYTGNGTNDTAYTWDETHANMQPDWLWFKNRDENQSHAIFDSVRGATLRLIPNETGAEGTENTNLDSFDTNGFTVDYEAIVNGNNDKMVAWGWKAGTSFTNDASATGVGTIDSTGSVNTTAGFSIISYTGNGSANQSVAHGLSAVPKMLIVKRRNTTGNWGVYHESIGNTNRLYLNDTSAASSGNWNNTTPTSSVFTIDDGAVVNGSSDTYIAYCFADVKGFSKVGGSYVGNGNADGTFIYTGFKPALFLLKANAAGENWRIFDNKRSTFNPNSTSLQPNSYNPEASNTDIDFCSNGIKLRTTSGEINPSGTSFIYMAFAENPFTTSTGVPATAR